LPVDMSSGLPAHGLDVLDKLDSAGVKELCRDKSPTDSVERVAVVWSVERAEKRAVFSEALRIEL